MSNGIHWLRAAAQLDLQAAVAGSTMLWQNKETLIMQHVTAEANTRLIDDSPITKLLRVLAEQGVIAALRILNARTPHRYTAVYKYTPEVLRSIYLVDAFDPRVVKGGDVPNEDAYCVLLRKERKLAFGQAEDAACSRRLASPVVSYCGVLLVRSDGEPFGSLCHYDVARCQEPASQMPYLELMAPYIVSKLEAEGH